jgi:hypothetical protein
LFIGNEVWRVFPKHLRITCYFLFPVCHDFPDSHSFTRSLQGILSENCSARLVENRGGEIVLKPEVSTSWDAGFSMNSMHPDRDLGRLRLCHRLLDAFGKFNKYPSSQPFPFWPHLVSAEDRRNVPFQESDSVRSALAVMD